jgi:hypothetical protein
MSVAGRAKRKRRRREPHRVQADGRIARFVVRTDPDATSRRQARPHRLTDRLALARGEHAELGGAPLAGRVRPGSVGATVLALRWLPAPGDLRLSVDGTN